MKIQLTNAAGTFDITNLATTASWTGDYRNCARTLDVGLFLSPELPGVDCPVGSAVTLAEDGWTLFSGYVLFPHQIDGVERHRPGLLRQGDLIAIGNPLMLSLDFPPP